MSLGSLRIPFLTFYILENLKILCLRSPDGRPPVQDPLRASRNRLLHEGGEGGPQQVRGYRPHRVHESPAVKTRRLRGQATVLLLRLKLVIYYL